MHNLDLAEELQGIDSNNIRDRMVSSIFSQAERIANNAVHIKTGAVDWDSKLDNILTSRLFGLPIMLLVLAGVLWLTVTGANYPSQLLSQGFYWGEEQLTTLFRWAGAPNWLHGLVVLGMYKCLSWVVAVMLPPMAIFFPLFTLLEDLGYLPRIAFNLDSLFRKVGAHGKQALTMSMGFGCNAAGVVACRIIESPRERLIAMLTNNFVTCNGRFPTLITLSSVFMGGAAVGLYKTVITSTTVIGIVLVGILVTFMMSWLLSATILKGVPSMFNLELPPYRKPQLGPIILRSILDRTIFVLGRAVAVAAPAGAIIWTLANVKLGNISILAWLAGLLDPFGKALGMDGVILVGFLLGLPANEIVLPIILMTYLSTGTLIEVDSLQNLGQVLIQQHNWTWLTALCTMLFSLLHFPCSTTLWTIYKETNSWKWMLLAALLPLSIAIILTFVVTQISHMLF